MQTQQINDFFTFLQSQKSSQHFLRHCYNSLNGVEGDVKSYNNCSVFQAYIEHGLAYYKEGNELDLFLKPLLHFYGMSHLLKACILATRPDYPESSALLAHGVSSRKRKKKAYTFLNDEVNIQTKGLFPYASTHLFDLPQIPFAKISMDTLLRNIPELVMFYKWQGETAMVRIGEIGGHQMQFPKYLIGNHQVTEQGFVKKIEHYLPKILKVKSRQTSLEIQLDEPVNSETGLFKIHEKDQGIYFPAHSKYAVFIPEALIHYLLLYNLSMLSRYEPSWWQDLITDKPDFDYPIVRRFLDCTATKMPLALGRYLLRLY